jgi:TRAP-type C4-dicarboxylate transport system permease small subunit
VKNRRIPLKFEEGVAVACMALLLVITMLNVITRYLTDQSFAWTEEISIFLMVVMALAGASAVAARDRHIRIEYFYERGSPARRRAFKVVSGCLSGLLFVAMTVLFARTTADEWHYAETSMGLGLPLWWFTIFSPLLCVLIALRSFGAAWNAARSAEP